MTCRDELMARTGDDDAESLTSVPQAGSARDASCERS